MKEFWIDNSAPHEDVIHEKKPNWEQKSLVHVVEYKALEMANDEVFRYRDAWTKVCVKNSKLEAALIIALVALEGCGDDMHYAGYFPRHKNEIEQIRKLLNEASA